MKPQSFRLIPDMEERYCMSVGVLAGDFLFIGGLFDVDDEGNALHPEDAAMQFRGIYEQMNHVLAAHGGTAADVVSETIYYGCSAEEYSERLVPHRLAFYQGCNGPSVVGVQVAGFIEPAIQVEVTAVEMPGIIDIEACEKVARDELGVPFRRHAFTLAD